MNKIVGAILLTGVVILQNGCFESPNVPTLNCFSVDDLATVYVNYRVPAKTDPMYVWYSRTAEIYFEGDEMTFFNIHHLIHVPESCSIEYTEPVKAFDIALIAKWSFVDSVTGEWVINYDTLEITSDSIYSFGYNCK